MSLEHQFRQRVESCGAIFVRLEGGSVYFRDTLDKPIISLYAFACDTENIRLAIKGQREMLAVDLWEVLI